MKHATTDLAAMRLRGVLLAPLLGAVLVLGGAVVPATAGAARPQPAAQPRQPAEQPVQSTASTWPLFQQSLTRWGLSDDLTTVSQALPHVIHLWQSQTGGQIYSSPVVENGVVYAGSEDGNIYAVTAATGAQLWSYHTGGFILNARAIANGIVYAGAEDGYFYALNATTGALVWSYRAAYPSEFGIVSSPAVDLANNLVIITAHDPGAVYAFNPTTGAVIWRTPEKSDMSWSSPAIENDRVYVGSADGHLLCLDELTGHQIWSTPIPDSAKTPPVLVDGLAVIADISGHVTAVDATSGAVDASFTTSGAINTAMATDGTNLYVASYDQHLYALSLPALSEVWSVSLGGSPTAGGVTLSGGVAYVGTDAKVLGAYSTSNGAKIWHVGFSQLVGTAPALVGNTIYVGASDGSLSAYAAAGLAVQPAMALPGAAILLSGAGFTRTETVRLTWGTITGTLLGQVKTGPAGMFTNASVTLPAAADGMYQIIAHGMKSHDVYTGTVTLAPQLTVVPVSSGKQAALTVVNPTTVVKLTGAGFVPGQTVTISWQSNIGQTALASAVVKPKGTLALTVTIPSAVVGNDQVLASTGSPATVVADTWVVVHPIITLTPNHGPAGTTFVVSGAGFSSGEPLNIYWGPAYYAGQMISGTLIGTASTNSLGTVISGTAQVPITATIGKEMVIGWGMISFSMASAQFTVAAAAPALPAGFAARERRAD